MSIKSLYEPAFKRAHVLQLPIVVAYQSPPLEDIEPPLNADHLFIPTNTSFGPVGYFFGSIEKLEELIEQTLSQENDF